MASPLPTDKQQVPVGQRKPSSQWGEYNGMAFVVGQLISRMQTAMPVRVMACTNAGDLSPVGFVDVLPLVMQIDTEGVPTPHTTVYNLPYMRMQGGRNAVIIDPEVGDIGIAVFASRDISNVKKGKRASVPGSRRQFSYSDGMYIGGILNGVPTQYIQFAPGGITIHAPAQITLDTPLVVCTGEVIASGTHLHTHVHGGVETGGSNTGGPNHD